MHKTIIQVVRPSCTQTLKTGSERAEPDFQFHFARKQLPFEKYRKKEWFPLSRVLKYTQKCK
jgi:hypothetical protein